MNRKRVITTLGSKTYFVLLAALLAVALSGCSKSTPPGPDMAGGKVEQAGFVFLRWQEGLGIMIWHNLDSFAGGGSGSTGDPVYHVRGSAVSPGGRRVDWEAQTTDGQTAQFQIDGTDYDLANGTLFLITAGNGQTDVRQLNRDLSGVQATYDSCVAFANGDPDVGQFIADVSDSQ